MTHKKYAFTDTETMAQSDLLFSNRFNIKNVIFFYKSPRTLHTHTYTHVPNNIHTHTHTVEETSILHTV